MLIIAGLGNPEAKYLKTRHNVGFIILDKLFNSYKNIATYEKYSSACAEIKIRRHKLLLLKPLTYMNLSGKAILSACNINKITEYNKDLIVVHDDLDIEFGKIKVRDKGSDAGHNGIKDIIYNLNTDNFIRLRVGIGRPKDNTLAHDYVLEDFSSEEYEYLLNDIFKKISSFINQYLELGFSKAKSLCNL